MLNGIRGMSAIDLAQAIARELRRSDITLGVKVDGARILIDLDDRRVRIEVRESQPSVSYDRPGAQERATP